MSVGARNEVCVQITRGTERESAVHRRTRFLESSGGEGAGILLLRGKSSTALKMESESAERDENRYGVAAVHIPLLRWFARASTIQRLRSCGICVVGIRVGRSRDLCLPHTGVVTRHIDSNYLASVSWCLPFPWQERWCEQTHRRFVRVLVSTISPILPSSLPTASYQSLRYSPCFGRTWFPPK